MDQTRRVYAAVLGVVGLFLAIQLGALALVQPFLDAELQAVEDPTDPRNSLVFFGVMLLATAGLLVGLRYAGQRTLRIAIILMCGGLIWMITSALAAPLTAAGGVLFAVGMGGPVVLAGGVIIGLFYYPEWYVVDTAGVLLGAGAAGIFGTSFGPLPALVFLTILAVYDAISVYGTEHMLTLAEGVMDMNVPVLLVVPAAAGYSFIDDTGPSSTDDTASGREALYIGLGDAVMPTILVTSAATFYPDIGALAVPGLALNLPALGAILGTITGLLVLMWLVLKGRPHAGLPLLNGGAIVGYLGGALIAGLSLLEALGLPL